MRQRHLQCTKQACSTIAQCITIRQATRPYCPKNTKLLICWKSNRMSVGACSSSLYQLTDVVSDAMKVSTRKSLVSNTSLHGLAANCQAGAITAAAVADLSTLYARPVDGGLLTPTNCCVGLPVCLPKLPTNAKIIMRIVVVSLTCAKRNLRTSGYRSMQHDDGCIWLAMQSSWLLISVL